MKKETRYSYEKRIKKLEEQNEKLRNDLQLWKSLGRAVFDWLVPFASKHETQYPNAEYGLKLFRSLGLL